MDSRRFATTETDETDADKSGDRALLRGLVNFLVAVALVCSLALGTAPLRTATHRRTRPRGTAVAQFRRAAGRRTEP